MIRNILLIFCLGFSFFVFADEYNPYSGDNYNNQSSQNNQANQIIETIKKDTQTGLDVLGKLNGSSDSDSKRDFFSDVGSNPTNGEFSNNFASENTKNPFKFFLKSNNI